MDTALRLLPTWPSLGTDFRCAIMNESVTVLACTPLYAQPLGEGSLRCCWAWTIMTEKLSTFGFGLSAHAIILPETVASESEHERGMICEE